MKKTDSGKSKGYGLFRPVEAVKLSLALVALCVCMVLPSDAMAQGGTRLTLDLRNAGAEQIFDAIEKQSSYVFYYKEGMPLFKGVTVSARGETIEQVLDRILPANYSYRINDRQVAITYTPPTAESNKAGSITGVVRESDGAPIVGATIVVQGTQIGTTTGVSGEYTLGKVPVGPVTLLVSCVGYKPASFPASVRDGETRTVNMTLAAGVEIDDVVVTALGIKKEIKSLTYNVQQVSTDEVLAVKDASFINGLAGKLAGVEINASSSGIGGATKVVMRGSKSISGNNNALYVIDGIPLAASNLTQPGDIYTGMGQSGDGISNFNPEDIESMTVLSGPAAAALYGRDAANGVVMITTKKGAEGVSLNVTNSTTFFSPFVMPRFQNTYGSETGSYYSWGGKLATPSSYDPKDFFQTGFNTTNSVSLSTGNATSRAYFSAASVTAQGIIPNNDLDRYNFTGRYSTDFLNDKLHFDFGAQYMIVEEQNMLAQGQYFNPLIPVYLFPRGDDISKYENYERYNPSRNFKTQFWPYGDQGLQMQNPYWIINRDMFNNNKERYLMSASLRYDIADWIDVIGRARVDKMDARMESRYAASTSGLFADKAGAYYYTDYYSRLIYADAMVNMRKNVGKFSLSANVGASIQDSEEWTAQVGGDLMSLNNKFIFQNLNKSLIDRLDQGGYHSQEQALFATAQVGYNGMVYLDVTARNDWMSALANTVSTSVFYPSVGLSGILTDIFDMKSKTLSFLKARVSYSEVGNAPTHYLTIPYYAIVEGYNQTTSFSTSKNFQPERTKSVEAGINAMLWGNKLNIDVTAYHSSTYNQVFNPLISASSGVTNYFVNAGRVDNKGIELTATLNQNLGRVKWNSTLTYSINRNEIKKMLENYEIAPGRFVTMDSMDMGGSSSYKMIIRKGGSLSDIYVNTLKTDEHGYTIVTISGQNVIADPTNFIYAGSAAPKYRLGFRNSFAWKGLDVGFLITARIGGVGVSATQAIMDSYGVSETSAQARDAGGATVNGQKIPAQSYFQTIGGGTAGLGAYYVYDATNVRLSEMTIGYDVPIQKYCNWIKGLNVSLVGRNLWMFYNKSPFDPELTASTDTYYQGYDYFMPPSLRSIGFSVKLSF